MPYVCCGAEAADEMGTGDEMQEERRRQENKKERGIRSGMRE